MRASRLYLFCFIVLAPILFHSSLAQAENRADYRDIAQRIETQLQDAATLYKDGRAKEAQTKVQNTYFHLFENLEGPIRVNISAKHSNMLESEFGNIRRLIKNNAPTATVIQHIQDQITAIHATVPELETGFQIKAEAGTGSNGNSTEPKTSVTPPEPYWVNVVDSIEASLNTAYQAYLNGDKATAIEAMKKAQFAGYKNSQMETAVRLYASQREDAEFNSEFGRISRLIESDDAASKVGASNKVLLEDLRAILPGLPLVGKAAEEAKSQANTANDTDWEAIAASILKEIAKAQQEAQDGSNLQAASRIQDAYFDIFEASGMEQKVGIQNATQKTQIEAHFSRLAALFRDRAPSTEISQAVADMKTDLNAAAVALGSNSDTTYSLFLYSLLIIVREGFEAMLIVSAVIAYLYKTGHGDKLPVIRNSVIAAVLASFATAGLVKLVFDASAASQEVLEGATMLLASVVLFSMSYWLISKAEAEHWATFIREKIGSTLSSGSLKALWFVSFLSVYREGAETVLFYQALATNGTAMGTTAIVAGFLVGCVGLAVIYFVIKKGTAQLPIRPFFMVTGSLMYLMSFVFIGKGVMELVEGKVIEPNLVSWLPEFSFLGIYPYTEAAIPQFVLILAALFAYAVIKLNSRRAEAKHLSS